MSSNYERSALVNYEGEGSGGQAGKKETALIPASIQAMPDKLCNLPPLHNVANQILQLAGDPDADLKPIASAIETDPAFAADVLYLANSPLFGISSILHGVRHALVILGLERIKSLACTTAIRAFVGRKTVPCLVECWQHSAACAVIAELLAPCVDLGRDRSYTAGLMHDIGRLGLLQSYASEYAPVLLNEYELPEDILRAEIVAVGVNHCDAGAWLAKTWGFPGSFADISARHHDSIEMTSSDLLYVIQMACLLADSIGFCTVAYKSLPDYASAIGRMPPWLQSRFPWSRTELREHVQRRLDVMGAY
jgi:HD-like signal output (HDOD) protein